MMRDDGPFHRYIFIYWMPTTLRHLLSGIRQFFTARCRLLFFLCCNHEETIRLWDAFETGSIPVMLAATKFLNLLPLRSDPNATSYQPVATLESWEGLGELLRDAQDQPEVYAARQRRNIAWWRDFKAQLSQTLDERISLSFSFALPASTTRK